MRINRQQSLKTLNPISFESIKDRCKTIENYFSPNKINIKDIDEIIDFYKNIITHLFNEVNGQQYDIN